MRITGSMDIAASPEIVWSYLVEPEKAKQWFTNIKVYDWTSEENDVVGSTFYWEEEAAGKTYKLHFVTTGWEPFKEFSFKMTSGDFFKSYLETWAIERTDSGCRFSFDDRIEFPYGIIGKVMEFFGRGSSEKTGKIIMAKLKELAEREAKAHE